MREDNIELVFSDKYQGYKLLGLFERTSDLLFKFINHESRNFDGVFNGKIILKFKGPKRPENLIENIRSGVCIFLSNIL